MHGGVELSPSLRIVGEVVDHLPMQEAVECIRVRVVAGEALSQGIKDQPLFPRLVYKMTSVGEQTGGIDDMLLRTADYYDQEFENVLHKLSTLLEPVLIVFIGFFVAITVVALYMPIFRVTELVG